MRKLFTALLALMPLSFLFSQVTTSTITGTVQDAGGKELTGATVKATHLPTGAVYSTITRAGGNFDIPNVNPGGPYTIEISFVGYENMVKNDVSLTLGTADLGTFTLSSGTTELQTVTVSTQRRASSTGKGGVETTIGRDALQNLPTVGRNLADFLRAVPQAKITADGGISLAGQNNRYNSFYIDGAVNNDVFGLAGSGTNGGQAGIAPISMDAIDQFQVSLSPYDVSLGNFTGGAINAITRSGTNDYTGSVYYFFRNQDLSGKTPGVDDKDARTKLADFSNKTVGFRVGGPIIKNKLFFFLNGELQRDERPQPFVFNGNYKGNSTQADLDNLANYLRSTYNYDPGGYLDNPETVEANRVAAKIDWVINQKHKLSASYRYNDGFRNNTSRSGNNVINFFNNGYVMPNKTNSASLELNSRFSNTANNKFLLTLTDVKDDRGPIGDAFPRVWIRDGAGSIYFGTEEFSTANLLEQNNAAIFDVFKLYKGRHTLSFGTDDEISKSTNIFIRQNYGSYEFADMQTFMTGGLATNYNRSYSLLDPGKTGDQSLNAAAKFTTMRLAFFASDEFKINNQLTVTLGLRLDNTTFITTPKTDQFFNDSALPKISQYYDMHGARSGQKPDPMWSINPRLGFVYKPMSDLTIRGGAGLFTGRVPLVWPGGMYNNNGISIAGIRSKDVAFRPDAFNQYTASDFGINVPIPSGQVDLIAKDFKMNQVFRASLGADKTFGDGWKVSVEGVITQNIKEIAYQQVNILPPAGKSVGVDSRNVYDLSGNFPKNVPARADGSNPYTGVYLLSNNDGKKGHSWSVTASLNKTFGNGFAINANYSYGKSTVFNEGTSSQNSSQWRYMETVNGRNFLQLSESDFSPRHRIFAYVSKKFTYAKGLLATTVSLVYTGQSGSPYSYVLNRGMVRDYDNFETNDLMFIPTEAQLNNMIFLPNTVGNTTYTPEEQKAALNTFIENDDYLSENRGGYAERNGARTPFTNILDLKLAQDINLKFGKRTYSFQITYDVFNFTNMLNYKWGKQYYATNDQYPLVEFSSYVGSGTTDLTPQYKFTPIANKSQLNISDGVFNSSRWSSQIGIRFSF